MFEDPALFAGEGLSRYCHFAVISCARKRPQKRSGTTLHSVSVHCTVSGGSIFAVVSFIPTHNHCVLVTLEYWIFIHGPGVRTVCFSIPPPSPSPPPHETDRAWTATRDDRYGVKVPQVIFYHLKCRPCAFVYTFPRGSTQTFLRFLSIKCCKRGREKNARRPSFFFSIPCTRQPCHPAGLLCCLFEDVCRLASLSMSCVCTGSFCMGNFHVAVFLWCVSLVLRQDYRGSVGSLISPGGAVVSWIICSFGRRFCPSPSTCGVSEIWPWMKIRSAGREKLSQHLFFCGELWVENFIANCISVWLRPFLHSCTHREILHGWENHRGPLVLSFSDTRSCAKFAINQSIDQFTGVINQSTTRKENSAGEYFFDPELRWIWACKSFVSVLTTGIQRILRGRTLKSTAGKSSLHIAHCPLPSEACTHTHFVWAARLFGAYSPWFPNIACIIFLLRSGLLEWDSAWQIRRTK